jgi:hypothetical protein
LVLWLPLTTACVLEDQPVNRPDGGGGDADACGGCSGDKPVCDEGMGACVQCTPEDSSACVDTTPVCDPDDLVCVACVSSLDCDDPTAARCDTDDNECIECAERSDCDGIAGLPECNDGVCVQCTPDTELDDCDGTSCNPATFTCTATMRGSRETCETCLSDTECMFEDNRCVLMMFEGDPYPSDEMGFCLKTTDGGCEQPYSITLDDRESLSGPPLDDYCGINEALATCEAVRALVGNQRCDTGEDQQCPQPSGLCRQVGSLPNRCTYACGLPAQCPGEAPADTCGSSGSGGEDYCGG